MKGKFIGSFVAVGFFVAVLAVLLVMGGFASAGQLREIVLEDGSIIRAEVVSFKDGVYTLRSDTMGQLELKDTDIEAIREPGSVAAALPGKMAATDEKAPTEQDVDDMKRSLMTNPGLLGSVFSLRNDPDMQKILQDPEIMDKVMSGDVESLQNDPKFLELMENPKIQAIIEQMTDQ